MIEGVNSSIVNMQERKYKKVRVNTLSELKVGEPDLY